MTNLHNAVPEINTIRSQSASSGTSNVETECLFRISLILPVGWHTPARWKRSDQTQFFRIPFRDVWRVRQVRTLRARSALHRRSRAQCSHLPHPPNVAKGNPEKLRLVAPLPARGRMPSNGKYQRYSE